MEVSPSLRPLSWIATTILVLLSVIAPQAICFPISEDVPTEFRKGDPVSVKVNTLSSIKTHIPYSYYSLPFCKPNITVDSTGKLGDVLRGGRIENSPYVVSNFAKLYLCELVL